MGAGMPGRDGWGFWPGLPPRAWRRPGRNSTPPPVFSFLRKPGVGLVMVQARAGGSGPRFNLGEMTVTRCTVQLEGGYTGCAYVAGRSPGHAEAAAVLDALLQDPRHHDSIMKEIILPLEAGLKEKREGEAARTDSTRGRILHHGEGGLILMVLEERRGICFPGFPVRSWTARLPSGRSWGHVPSRAYFSPGRGTGGPRAVASGRRSGGLDPARF
jgi:alpha-D-ribose 1-methylphosphonate 5-triphosphate synthase subunit PhnG